MDSDPVGILLRRAADGDLEETESDLELLQKSATFLVETSSDRHRIRELLQTLERSTRAPAADTGTGTPFRTAALHVLEALARALLVHDPSPQVPPPRETQRLVAAVVAKKHTAEILRVIAGEVDSRPANLTRATGLSDVKVHRVLTWAMSNGLVLRSAADFNVHYRLSPLGETVLEAIDEPPWVSMAATLIRIGVQRQLLARDGEEWRLEDTAHPIVQRASLLTGLSPERAARGLNEFSRALQTAAVSNLAGALRYTPYAASQPDPAGMLSPADAESGHDIIISPPVFHRLMALVNPQGAEELVRWERLWSPRLDSLAESLMVRTVERAGIPTRMLREVLPHHYLRATKQARPYHLPLQGPILSIGGPGLNPVTAGLFFEYGVSVHLRHRPALELVWQQGETRSSFFPSADEDYGLVLRIFDEQTGATHFVVGGLRPSGTYAACRCFYRQAEELLETFPEQSFATVLRVPRSYSRRKQRHVVMEPQPVDTSTNRHGRLDMRYVEVLPLLAEAVLDPARQQRVQRHLSHTLRKAGGEFDRGAVKALAQNGMDETAPACRRVRDMAVAYTLMGQFEELVAMVTGDVLAGGAARRGAGALPPSPEIQKALRDDAGLSVFAAAAVARLLVRRHTAAPATRGGSRTRTAGR
jgi:DNA-binding HxlR family transcriptional regulator